VSATVAESRSPAEARFQLPEGTYRELIVKDRMTKFLKERLRRDLRKLKELREDARRYLPEDKAEEARLQHADEQARVKAAELADREVAAGKPIVVQAWQVQVSSRAHTIYAAAPSWLTTPTIHGGAATVRVFADDTCEPVSF
jgi:hypothetical protein